MCLYLVKLIDLKTNVQRTISLLVILDIQHGVLQYQFMCFSALVVNFTGICSTSSERLGCICSRFERSLAIWSCLSMIMASYRINTNIFSSPRLLSDCWFPTLGFPRTIILGFPAPILAMSRCSIRGVVKIDVADARLNQAPNAPVSSV